LARTGLAPAPPQAKARGSSQPLAVTVLSSLPPAKGVSPYTSHLVEALSKLIDVRLEVLCFASIYPSWLYPGGDPEDGGETPSFDGVRVRRLLSWYNPISWVWAGLTLHGSVVHAQWWSYFLAPVYTVVLGIARLRGIVLALQMAG